MFWRALSESNEHCALSWTEVNCRCDVSFERVLIRSRLTAWSYSSRKRKLWWKKFKIKHFENSFGEIWDSRSIEGNLTAILASLDHFYGIYGALSWKVRLQSPAFPYFLLLVQLKILNVHKTASKWFKKWRDSKKQNKNTRCHFYFYFC